MHGVRCRKVRARLGRVLVTRHIARFDRSKWRKFVDSDDVVHYATRLTRKDAEQLFRLADMTRALVGCERCLAGVGEHCRRKPDGQVMANHSVRVTHAREVVRQRFEPFYDRLHRPLCAVADGDASVVHKPAADAREVDCMACLVLSTKLSEE